MLDFPISVVLLAWKLVRGQLAIKLQAITGLTICMKPMVVSFAYCFSLGEDMHIHAHAQIAKLVTRLTGLQVMVTRS